MNMSIRSLLAGLLVAAFGLAVLDAVSGVRAQGRCMPGIQSVRWRRAGFAGS